MNNFLNSQLQQRQQTALYRTRLIHDSPQAPILSIKGKSYLTFCSNDYLGLANHPDLKIVLQQAVEQYGIGSGASHLVTGHNVAHQELEKTLAQYTQREKALLFSTGYMANIGVITALIGRNDAIFLDKLNHASLVDAALLSRAKIYRYAHNNMTMLEHFLIQSTAQHKLIVTDGVFSMDGDMALLPAMVQLAKKYQAWLMVDDAHGLGVLGETGRGTLEKYGLNNQDIPILIGTFGKAWGALGAFVAGSELLIEFLIQTARSYIYTTALPPALAKVIQASINISETESWRREYLQELITYFRATAIEQQIPLSNSITPIQVIILGTSERALAVSKFLYQQGIIVTAIRPPTVPQGTARLRITLSAAHTKKQVDKLINTLLLFGEFKPRIT